MFGSWFGRLRAASRSLRAVLVLGVVVALAPVAAATADSGGRNVLDSSMIGIPTGGLALYGVAGGGIPWDIQAGHAVLSSSGRLHVEVVGLVLATTHVNPIATGRAIVACGGAAVASTQAVPFSSTGHAVVNAVVDLPSPCLGPAVFFAGITGGGDRWFAVTGL